MNGVIARVLSAVRLGEPVGAAGWTFIPVFSSLAEGPAYRTLAEAAASGDLSVSELDSEGSVTALRARNHGRTGILVIDGEELKGARQNRVLNTTVYLPPGSDVVIPVSCVEAGRWRSESSLFSDSGYLAAAGVRHAARRSVAASLRACDRFDSDQAGVWRAVDDLAEHHGVVSRTRAMSDVLEQGRAGADSIISDVRSHQAQCGLVAVHGGRVLGMDVVSRPAAYGVLHERLLRSYASDTKSHERESSVKDLRAAKRFIVALSDAEGTQHRSPGAGISHRFTAARMTGDALTYRGAILHAAFFSTDEDRAMRTLSSFPGARRGLRQ